MRSDLKHWLLAASLTTALLTGCASSGSSNASATTEPVAAAEPPATMPTNIPPDSPFIKLRMGMSLDEMRVVVGEPTTIHTYMTGKAWIPFHFGGDNYRVAAHYKGQGIVTLSSNSSFSSGTHVTAVKYDPEEKGFE